MVAGCGNNPNDPKEGTFKDSRDKRIYKFAKLRPFLAASNSAMGASTTLATQPISGRPRRIERRMFETMAFTTTTAA